MRRLILLFWVAALGTALSQTLDYQGPTILSRGLGNVIRGGGDLVRLRPYLSLTGRYETGLTPVSVDSSGRIPEDDNYGGEVEFGVYGYRRWRRTLLGVNYRGNVRHYVRRSYYDGSNHSLSLGFTRQPSRRVVFTLREAAGMFTRNYGEYGYYTAFDPTFADVPANDIFHGRTYYASTMGDLTFLKSQRLSFNIGGSGMLVRRRSRALIGVTGWTARGDVQYRLSRTAVIGVDYGFRHYEFTSAFGASDVHLLATNLAFRLGRDWDLAMRIGAARVETLGLQRVAVDPIIAAIIGRTTGIEVLYRTNYVPSVDASLTRSFRKSSLSFGYRAGVSPGNGIYLTSRSEDATASYSHTAFRRWNVGVSGGYSSFSSLSQTIGKYRNYTGGGGVSCQLNSWAHLVGRYDLRRYEIGKALFKRFSQFASVGIAFSPGDLPLSLW